MNVVAIIQARMGSTRLPGKVLADIGGRSMLARVCDRLRRSLLIDHLLVATSLLPDDERIVAECDRLAVDCFRGDENDVLDRYYRAARAGGADAVVRVTADCPLIDPEVVDRVVAAFLRSRPDYAANTLQRTWPRGLDTEVMTAAALHRTWREATEPYERTHVTAYIYRHPESFRMFSVTGSQNKADYRWTVDAPEDLEFVRAVFRHFGDPNSGKDGPFFWQDVGQLLARKPGLMELNRHVRQKQLVEG